MIGKRVEWRVRGTRAPSREEMAKRTAVGWPPFEERQPVQEGVVDDVLVSVGASMLRYARHDGPSCPADDVRKGTVQAWNATTSTLLVERDDGAWEEVPVVCVHSVAA